MTSKISLNCFLAWKKRLHKSLSEDMRAALVEMGEDIKNLEWFPFREIFHGEE